ncbi:MAG TPA: hypothetical protein DGR97_12745 [Gammaproteobacteria bacterium]|nr:hypothetical protein [Woeseia sp.]HCU90810.1 hypothetical protein [Gammaproteobacteria bacterium]
MRQSRYALALGARSRETQAPSLPISRSVMKRFLILFVIFLSHSAVAENLDDIKAFLSSTYVDNRPGASVIIVDNGETMHEAGYGLANVEHGIPITPQTIFRVGSITKQFTAAAIMLLQQRGELSVGDPIEKYLPDYPTHGHEISIYHLLNHTSGIKSYTNIPGYMNAGVRTDLTTEELVAVFKNLPMDFAPGEDWNYNNSGYVLLGAIIEKVSGQSYADFIADNITAPLGLDSTLYGGRQVIPNRAAGYELVNENTIVNAGFISMTQPHAAGSMLSTPADLANWNKALTGGEFIHDSSYESMTTPANLNSGETFPYGYGLDVGSLRERRMISHGGGIHGFTCFSLWLPDDGLYIAVLTNGATMGADPTTVAKKIAAMYIGDPYPVRQAMRLAADDETRLAGSYKGLIYGEYPLEINATDSNFTLSIAGGPAQTLFAESRELLFMKNSLNYIIIEWEENAAPRLLYHYEENEPPVVLEKTTD